MGTRDEAGKQGIERRHQRADESFERLMREADRMPLPWQEEMAPQRSVEGDEPQAPEQGS